MKKIVALGLMLVLLVSLAACGEAKVSKPEKDNSNDKAIDTGSYAEGYTAYTAVIDALTTAYNVSVETYNAENDGIYEFFLPFLSIDMAFTASCGEESWQSVVEMLLDNCTAEEVGKDAYRIAYTGIYTEPESYESFENLPHEMYCAYDAATGAVQFYETVVFEGETLPVGFVEYLPLGGNRYALQGMKERAIVEYDGTTVTAFTYTRCAKDAYKPEADSVFGKNSISDGWVTENAEVAVSFTLDAQALTLWYAATETEYGSTEERTIVIDR